MRSHLERLEAESIFILREAVAESVNPVMLYSIGKDSAVMLHIAKKAFFPGTLPFPLLHVDTKWKFKEMYEFRDKVAAKGNFNLEIFTNPEGIEQNINPLDHGSEVHTEIMKTQALKMALDNKKYDLAFGGARRDEEKSRAKERIFPLDHLLIHGIQNQKPELWNNFNTRKKMVNQLGFFLYLIGLS